MHKLPITLPLAAHVLDTVAEENLVVKWAPQPGGAIKVLHIEDDPSVLRAIARALSLRGYEVFSAATRGEALRHLEVRGFRPDIILTDYVLGEGFTGDM